MTAPDARAREGISSTYLGAKRAASVRDVMRVVRQITSAPRFRDVVMQVTDGAVLERTAAPSTLPRLEAAEPIEGDALARRAVAGDAQGFGAFLDGIQASRVMFRCTGGVPVVDGRVAAVVRARAHRTLTTWREPAPGEQAFFLPEALVPRAVIDELLVEGHVTVDTLQGEREAGPRHPLELLGLARTAVQRRRETLETQLAEAWCASETRPLYVDGGISGSGKAAQSTLAVGVVKSHRTLYAAGGALDVVMTLAPGERTTAFAVRSPRRTLVASWYLRLRDAAGRDPFFGLVRVEVAHGSFTVDRADAVSRWVLAERAPVALPDQRWSTMAYGIRDCEAYLRAVSA